MSRFGRREEEDEDEGGNWLDSYSDLVTDLMAIFVVLFSFAMMMNSAVITHYEGKADSLEVSESLEQGGGVNAALQELEESLTAYIDEADLSEYLSIIQQGENIVLLRMSVTVLFDPGLADITPDAREILDRISGVMDEFKDNIKMITVEGHADIRPVDNVEFDTNWELSSIRAVNVVRYILEVAGSQLSPQQFSAVGYAEFQPIADNETPEGMAKNRRVDFILELNQDSRGIDIP